jgi:hypothetical protein
MPFIIYIAIVGALTVPSMMEWLEKDNLTSLFQLESIARWAFRTIISLHSDSSYPPVETGPRALGCIDLEGGKPAADAYV